MCNKRNSNVCIACKLPDDAVYSCKCSSRILVGLIRKNSNVQRRLLSLDLWFREGLGRQKQSLSFCFCFFVSLRRASKERGTSTGESQKHISGHVSNWADVTLPSSISRSLCPERKIARSCTSDTLGGPEA